MCGERRKQGKVVGLANRKQRNQKEVVQTFGYGQQVALAYTAPGRREV